MRPLLGRAHSSNTVRRSLWIKIPVLLGATTAWVRLEGPLALAVTAAIVLGGVALLLAIVLHPNSSLWAKTLWRAPRDTNAVALTFDDGPDPSATPAIVKILADRGIRAAFFVVGERARAHPEIVAQLHEAGHLVCNHTDTHTVRFHFGLWGAVRRELRACNEAIAAVIGREPAFFRSPQGHKNPALCDVLREMGMTAIGWQVRGLDSVFGDADAIVRRVVRGARAGGVIALHDGTGYGGRSDRTPTIEALPHIIDGLRARGLTFRRLDELLELEPYRPVET